VTDELDEHARWLTERRTGVGASDVAAIIGESPWASPTSVWADKLGLTPLERTPSTAMRLGTDLEPLIAKWFTEQTGLVVAGAQTMMRRGFALATLDGFVLEADSNTLDYSLNDVRDFALGVFESKYTSARPYDELPDRIMVQVQWQMYVTGLTRAYVAVLFLPGRGGPDFRVFDVDRDDARIAELVERCEAFWQHVVDKQPPVADDSPSTTVALQTAVWADVGLELPETVDVSSHASVLAELHSYKTEQRALDKLIRECENTLRTLLRNAEQGTIAGEVVVTNKEQSRTFVDFKAIRRDHGDKYDTHSTFRVLRVLQPNQKAS
jgi:putative phage-type endonuclease